MASAFFGFAAFGAFWGAWGASVPRVQDRAGIGDGDLGFALLFVGVGALPAMLLVGRALDRWGLRVAAGLIGLLGVTGAGLALVAVNLPSLCVGLTVAGASSGAADVAINAVAGRAEKTTGQPVITRAHGTFSTLVVLASLGTGVAAGADWPIAVPFAGVAAFCLGAGATMLPRLPPPAAAAPGDGDSDAAVAELPPRATAQDGEDGDGDDHVVAELPPRVSGGDGDDSDTAVAELPPPSRPYLVPLLLTGTLGALAFATENAHQSWSAVFAQDELDAGAGLTTVAPAVFAGTVGITRFAIGGLRSTPAQRIVLAGSLAAATGTLVIAAAPTLLVAALGLVLVGAGTAVLFPTLVGIVSGNVEESYRGRATSIVTTVSYLGFLLGPVYVGLWAEAIGLRWAMTAVAGLAAALFVLTLPLLRLGGFTSARPPPP